MSYDKPLPTKSIESEPYWEAANDERLVIQNCEDCNENIFPPRSGCPYCLSPDVQWIESTGDATVYSYSIVNRPPSKVWEDSVPYVLALIRLEEDVFMISQVVRCAPKDVNIGMDVTVTFDHVTDEVTLPKFEPV